MSGISSALCCATNATAKFIESELFNFIQHFMHTYLKITEVSITHFIIQFADMGTLLKEEDVNLATWVRAWVWQVGFMVDRVALGQVFSEYFGFPCQ
jgi:hypothetical protein